MRKNDPITKILSKNVESIQEGQSLSEVRRLMTDLSIHHVPIVKGNKLVGIVSFTDMMKLSLVTSGATEHTIDAIIDQQFTIKDVMSADPVTLGHTDNIRQAAEILAEGKFHSLPVTDNGGDLIGILTTTDLIRYLNDQY